jgi:hypothetical protein
MIMPADPKVGNAYRTENTPGIAFEQVTVTSVDRTFEGPLGPLQGGLVAEELHMDGTTEDKLFAPGYGEFFTAGGGDVESSRLRCRRTRRPSLCPPSSGPWSGARPP